ncbi:hypothetical protein ABIE45_004410 [Methylobacterium sp. OAE515]|uniref:hypothetical protein n=1 Tax=Methylobacterium sp. OAE515 TaxID=2817895 RepID=UPI001A0898B4
MADAIARTSWPTAAAARWALVARPWRDAPKVLLLAAPPDMATPIVAMLPTICDASVAIAPWARDVSAAKAMTSGSAMSRPSRLLLRKI